MKGQYVLLVAVVLLVLAGFAIFLRVIRVPPRPLTHVTMLVLRERIMLYRQKYGHLPTSLKRLPRIPDKFNSTRDGWGRRIVYSADTRGVVTLLSYGADGRLGGKGEDSDMVGKFAAEPMEDMGIDEAGSWIEEPTP